MSRRPGIGKNWYDKYSQDLYPKDFITANGKKYKIPLFYDKIFDLTNPNEMEIIKQKRKETAERHKDDNTLKRLCERHIIQKKRSKKLVRSLENV